MDEMIIKEGNNRFFIGKNGEDDIARITYYYKDMFTIVIDHTFVSPELRGKNIAGRLLNKVVGFAQENKLKIIPVCSYAVKKMTRNDEYLDVLYQE